MLLYWLLGISVRKIVTCSSIRSFFLLSVHKPRGEKVSSLIISLPMKERISQVAGTGHLTAPQPPHLSAFTYCTRITLSLAWVRREMR